jgi:hypothetical protein
MELRDENVREFSWDTRRSRCPSTIVALRAYGKSASQSHLTALLTGDLMKQRLPVLGASVAAAVRCLYEGWCSFAASCRACLFHTTGASLKLSILNPGGRIWTMVAGGGASVIYADTVGDLGLAHELGNYAEYSGAPNTAETYAYAKTLLDWCASSQGDRVRSAESGSEQRRWVEPGYWPGSGPSLGLNVRWSSGVVTAWTGESAWSSSTQTGC